MTDIVAPLTEVERAVLMIAAEGESMIPIGAWESAVRSLCRRGFLQMLDAVNFVITAAGRAAIDTADTAAVRDLVNAMNRAVP